MLLKNNQYKQMSIQSIWLITDVDKSGNIKLSSINIDGEQIPIDKLTDKQWLRVINEYSYDIKHHLPLKYLSPELELLLKLK